MEEELHKTQNSYILKDPSYKNVKSHLKNLTYNTKEFLLNIERYLMLNAGIKNSLVFLSRHIENALRLDKKDQVLYIKANHIFSVFKNANRMQDIDYINKESYLLHSASKDPKTQKFIAEFNLHTQYLLTKFPQFIKSTSIIINNNLGSKINKLRDNFSKIVLQDFKYLDIFASILFFTFILSLGSIILLFVKYFKEHAQLSKATESLEYSLSYDILTDLYNRKAFEKDLVQTLNPYLLIINIDGFKHINDIYGNNLGNTLLKNMADFLKTLLQTHDCANIYRLGGDEFGVLFNNIAEEDALHIAHELERNISLHNFQLGSLRINLSVSIACNNVQPILENADLALKEIKKDVNTHLIKYDEKMNLKKNVEQNLETINLIKESLLNDTIVPYFQPIVNLKTSKIEKYEALVRIIRPNKEALIPHFFLEVSKRTPYYHDITKIMIEKTIATAANYPLYRFSINLSMKDILSKELTDILFQAFDANPTVSSRIDIELLESDILEDEHKIQNFIKRAHSYGSKILIDDFGSGYSNFSYFSSLDVDIIKIDGEIVSEITTDERKLHMLKSIHLFTKGMMMKNIAEFVETREMALLLQEIGVEYAQGFYFGRPAPEPLEIQEVVI